MIGVSSYIFTDTSGRDYKIRRMAVASTYIKSIERCGVPSVVLPIISEDLIEKQLEGITGLVMSGGEDVSPHFYGEEQLKLMGVPSIERDVYEKKLLEVAMKKGIPILGICRGMQFFNVFCGGTLYQDLSYIKPETAIKHDQFAHYHLPSHKIKMEKDSLLYDIFKKEEVWVNSFHHQSVKSLGKDLRITAKSSDGVIEAMELLDRSVFRLFVQFHPEGMCADGNDEMFLVFKRFTDEVKKQKKA